MRYLIVLLLVGCAAERYWEKPGSSAQDFEMDKGQCQAQAFGAPGMYTVQVAMVYNACMRGKGWYQVEQTSAAPASARPREDFRECADEAERRSGTRDVFDPQSKAAYNACMARARK